NPSPTPSSPTSPPASRPPASTSSPLNSSAPPNASAPNPSSSAAASPPTAACAKLSPASQFLSFSPRYNIAPTTPPCPPPSPISSTRKKNSALFPSTPSPKAYSILDRVKCHREPIGRHRMTSMGTLNAIYVRAADAQTVAALIAEQPTAYTEPGTDFFAIDRS